MARDYTKRPKKKAPRKSSGSRGSSGRRPWAWLLTGLLVGLVGGAVVYLKISMFPSAGETAASKVPAKQAAAPAKTRATPKFDFYTLLPEMEVAVPEPARAKPAVPSVASDQEVRLPPPFEDVKYRLQIASFKRFEDADSFKAKLAMSGHVVEIHSIKLDNGQVWYRVYSPVLPNRDKAVALQKVLQDQAITSMLLRAS